MKRLKLNWIQGDKCTLLQRLVDIVVRVAFCQIVVDLKYRPTCVLCYNLIHLLPTPMALGTL